MRRVLAVVLLLAVVAAIVALTRRNDAPRPLPAAPSAAQPTPRAPRDRAAASVAEDDDARPVPFVSRRSGPRADDADAWTRRMTIAVTSDADESPVQGALVRVLKRFDKARAETATTGADGIVTLDAPNRSIVIVRAPGFVTHTLTPDEGRDLASQPRLDVALEPGTPLTGRVVHAGTKSPVPDAEVYAWDAQNQAEIDFDVDRFDHDESTGVRTGADGTFAFNAAPPGRDVVLAARADGLCTETRRIAAGGPAENVVIELGGGASVSGFVRDADGKPIEGAFVYAVLRGDDFLLRIPEVRDLHSDGVKLPPRAVSAADGSYRIEGLATPAAYVVTAARARWDRGLAEPAELLSPGTAETRDVVVHDRCTIHGSLFGPNGEPVDFDSFEIRTPDGNRYRNPFANGSSSEGSTFTTTDVVPGEYVVEVRANGPWPPVSVPVTVKAAGTTEFEARFAPGTTLSGFVTDEAGAPIEGATVYADGHKAESGGDGTFRIDGVRAGALNVSVVDDLHLTLDIPNVDPSGAPLRVVMSPAASVVFRHEPHDRARITLCLARAALGNRWMDSSPLERDDFRLLRNIPVETPFDLTIRDSNGACHAMTIRGLRVAQGKTLDLGRIAFQPMRTLRGIVLGPDGGRIGGAIVERVDPTGAVDRVITTDSTGAFAFRGAPPNALLVTVDAPGLPRSFRFLNSESAERVQMDAGVTVTGRLRDKIGAPVCGGDLIVCPAGDAVSTPTSPYWEVTTDSMGEFTVLVPPGKHSLLSRRVIDSQGVSARFADTPVTEFDAALPGPVRIDARLR